MTVYVEKAKKNQRLNYQNYFTFLASQDGHIKWLKGS